MTEKEKKSPEQLEKEVRELREKLRQAENGSKTVITTRLQVSLHKALQDYAHEKRTSVNRICVKLIEMAVTKEIDVLFEDCENES